VDVGIDAILGRQFSRRKFIAATAATAGAVAIAAQCDPYQIRKTEQDKTAEAPSHSVWVWQFSVDGTPEHLADVLASHNMSVLVKTHDGLDWMSKYDRSSHAVSGPERVAALARIFENAGVPFHTWSVVKGIDPLREAQMTADVLQAGARSMVLDLEGYAGFWVGSAADAMTYGNELRRLTPFGRVDISIDARPWRLGDVPLNEFVGATDAIWPQLYWESFKSVENINLYRQSGYDAGGVMDSDFLLASTADVLKPFGRPVIPIGQGASDGYSWERFNYRAYRLGLSEVSVWRYGVTPTAILSYLGQFRAGTQPPVPRTPTPGPSPTPQASATRTPKPTRTPSPTPSKTAKPTRTASPTRTPTGTPTPAP
jgi:hypothetical protein